MPSRIIRYPDPRLALPALPVTAFDGALRELARDCWRRCGAARVSESPRRISAVALRVVVLDLDPSCDGAADLCQSGDIMGIAGDDLHREGSVSMPGSRTRSSVMPGSGSSYRDIDGNNQARNRGACARSAHQHEIDQLNGLFWIKRLSRLKRSG